MSAVNNRATKPTIIRRNGWSNFRCMNQVKTSIDLMVEKTNAPKTEYPPRLICIIPIELNVRAIRASKT